MTVILCVSILTVCVSLFIIPTTSILHIIVPPQPVITSISNEAESTTTDSIIVHWTLGYNLVSHDIFVILSVQYMHNKLAAFLLTATEQILLKLTYHYSAPFRVMTLLYLILPLHWPFPVLMMMVVPLTRSQGPYHMVLQGTHLLIFPWEGITLLN